VKENRQPEGLAVFYLCCGGIPFAVPATASIKGKTLWSSNF
jgi:hypothetical protein